MPNQHVLSSFQRTCQPRDRHRDRLRPPSAAPKQQMATPEMVELANRLADEAAKVTTRYFSLDVEGKSDESPVTIADREAEQVMRDLILEECPDHGVFGEEMGLSIGTEAGSSYLWVFDPIDGTKSFITGKPLFGTLVSLLYDGEPILGIIDQPILKERWVGIKGRPTTLNGEPISTLQGRTLAESYLYATTPHMFSGATEDAFIRVRDQARIPLYGCDCYAYGLLAAGYCNVVMEADLKPYDYMALVPVVEGAGGVITNWAGQELRWRMTPDTVDQAVKFSGEVLAASDRKLHSEVLRLIGWASPG